MVGLVREITGYCPLCTGSTQVPRVGSTDGRNATKGDEDTIDTEVKG